MKEHIYKNPKKYSENNSLQYNFAMDMLSNIVFESTSRVLDIGCGDGAITSEISKIVQNGCVIGTDISSPMVDYASQKYMEQPNLRFLQMDATKNMFREQFDIITSFNCLHWVEDQQSALNGISRSATAGAQVALLLSHRKSLYHFVLDKLCSSKKWSFYFTNYTSPRSFYDLEHYKEMLNSAGLSIVNITEREMEYTFSSKEKLKEFFNAAGAQIKYVPEPLKADFLDDFSREFIEQITSDTTDGILVVFWCLQVHAFKPPSLSISNELPESGLFAKL